MADATNLDAEEKPDDVIVTGQMKVWNCKRWSLSDLDYQNTIKNFEPDGTFERKFGVCIARGADIAGRTAAAVYLTSEEMSGEGYVLRFDLLHECITRIALNKAPKGLHVTYTDDVLRNKLH